jgi:hypothetical protein
VSLGGRAVVDSYRTCAANMADSQVASPDEGSNAGSCETTRPPVVVNRPGVHVRALCPREDQGISAKPGRSPPASGRDHRLTRLQPRPQMRPRGEIEHVGGSNPTHRWESSHVSVGVIE